MERYERIAVLDNEVQAQLLDAVLSERGIPHALMSYHDSALDGVFQLKGWGHIEAPVRFRDEIVDVLEDIKREALSAPTETEDGEEE